MTLQAKLMSGCGSVITVLYACAKEAKEAAEEEEGKQDAGIRRRRGCLTLETEIESAMSRRRRREEISEDAGYRRQLRASKKTHVDYLG